MIRCDDFSSCIKSLVSLQKKKAKREGKEGGGGENKKKKKRKLVTSLESRYRVTVHDSKRI